MPVPKSHAEGFRNALLTENLRRLIIGGAVLSMLELTVFITMLNIEAATHYYPVAAVLFNCAMMPLILLLKRRPGLVPLKRALIYFSVMFYLGWSCLFTWANRASAPGIGINILFSPYLLMVYGIAIVLYLEPAWSAVLFVLSLALFIALVPYGALNPREASINTWNAIALNLFAWFTSRMFFVFRLRTYIDTTLIREKNDELRSERNNLVEALASVKQLSGLLPICSSCKKVRDDNGYWQQVEEYISERSGATFSHGLCPDCMEKIYPGLEK